MPMRSSRRARCASMAEWAEEPSRNPSPRPFPFPSMAMAACPRAERIRQREREIREKETDGWDAHAVRG